MAAVYVLQNGFLQKPEKRKREGMKERLHNPSILLRKQMNEECRSHYISVDLWTSMGISGFECIYLILFSGLV